jgi:hypothetical protein
LSCKIFRRLSETEQMGLDCLISFCQYWLCSSLVGEMPLCMYVCVRVRACVRACVGACVCVFLQSVVCCCIEGEDPSVRIVKQIRVCELTR